MPGSTRKHYPVTLTDIEREHLRELSAAGTAPARKLKHARVLLKADQSPSGPAWVDEAIAEAVESSRPTVARIRRQYVEDGPEAALNRRTPRRRYERKLDGEHEARLVALARSAPPEGRPAGACGCRRTAWWSWRWWRASRSRPFAVS